MLRGRLVHELDRCAVLFPAFAAIFLGATQFNFRPNVWGTLLAIFTLALGVQGLQLSSSTGGYWITPLFNGLALLAAVVSARSRPLGWPRMRAALTVRRRSLHGKDPKGPRPKSSWCRAARCPLSHNALLDRIAGDRQVVATDGATCGRVQVGRRCRTCARRRDGRRGE